MGKNPALIHRLTLDQGGKRRVTAAIIHRAADAFQKIEERTGPHCGTFAFPRAIRPRALS